MHEVSLDKRIESSEEEIEELKEEHSFEEILLDEENNLRNRILFSKKQALLKAIRIGDSQNVEILLQEIPELLNKSTPNELTLLGIAIASDQKEIVELLLAKGCALRTGDGLIQMQKNMQNFYKNPSWLTQG